MGVLEAIWTRHSIRQFQAKPVAEDLVENLLRAGIIAVLTITSPKQTDPAIAGAQPFNALRMRCTSLLS